MLSREAHGSMVETADLRDRNEARHRVPWERFAQLLDGPRRSRIGGDGDVHDASAIVSQPDQHEQQAAGRRRDDAEIRSRDLAGVVPQERAPCLRRRTAPPNHAGPRV